MSKRKLRSTLTLAVTCLLGLSACGIQPGDYSVFRVSYGESSSDLTCGVPEPGAAHIPTGGNLGEPETLVIFAHDELYYLEYDGIGVEELVTLEGTRDGKVYSFVGTEASYESFGDDGTTFLTRNEEIDLDLELDGKNIEGTVTHTQTTNCVGLNCPLLGFPQSCTTTQPFAGSLVPDAQVEVGI